MRQLLKRLRCEHEYRLVRNIGGDEINARDGKRSECECTKCGKRVLWDYLDGEGLVQEKKLIGIDLSDKPDTTSAHLFTDFSNIFPTDTEKHVFESLEERERHIEKMCGEGWRVFCLSAIPDAHLYYAHYYIPPKAAEFVREEEVKAQWDLRHVQDILSIPPKAVMTAFVEGSTGTHDDNACAALKYYDERADYVPSAPRFMKEVAAEYGTTTEAMKEHWRCITEELMK